MMLRACILALFAAAGPLSAQVVPEVSWYQGPARQGGVAWLVVQAPEPLAAVTGRLAGQPLHFRRVDDNLWAALAAVPVNARTTVTAEVTAEFRDGATSRREVSLAVVPGAFREERLSVDPAFTRPPEGELAIRIARERELQRAVMDGAHDTPRLWEYPFVQPRESRITSPFGGARVFNRVVQSRHLGTDFDGQPGDPVYAANRGVVALTGDFYYAGNAIYVDHGKGLITGYFHLSEILVQQGDTVTPGQLIGRVGSSGRVTGPHLHWSVLYGRVSVDGMNLLALPPFPAPPLVAAPESSQP